MTFADIVYVPPELQSIMGSVDTFVRHRAKSNTRAYDKYHPSAFGQCLRKMQYMRYVSMGLIHGEEEEFESKMLRLFEKGHSTQARWEKYFIGLGVLRGIWTCTNPLCRLFDDSGEIIKTNDVESYFKEKPRKYGEDNKIGIFKPDKCICGCNRFAYEEICVEDEELNLRGHVDMILDFSRFDPSIFNSTPVSFDVGNFPKSPIVVDMKTMNDYRWKQKLMKSGVSLSYRIQLCIYANLLDLDYGVLIYENKNTSEARAFKIERATDTVFAQVKQQAIAMNKMAALERPKLPPPRPGTKDDYECSNCGFKSVCHKSTVWADEDKLNDNRQKFYGNLLE